MLTSAALIPVTLLSVSFILVALTSTNGLTIYAMISFESVLVALTSTGFTAVVMVSVELVLFELISAA